MFVDIHSHKLQYETNIGILNFPFNHTPIPNQYFSASIHPWDINKETINKLSCFKDLLHDTNCIAIGEVGFDKNYLSYWKEQILIFDEILKINKAYNKPLIIHCVKAFNELFETIKRHNNKATIIIHGFSKNEQVLNDVLKKGFYVSLGTTVFKESFYKVVKKVPLDKLFLETDNSNYTIEQVYQQVCDICQVEIEILKSQILKNFKIVFINEY